MIVAVTAEALPGHIAVDCSSLVVVLLILHAMSMDDALFNEPPLALDASVGDRGGTGGHCGAGGDACTGEELNVCCSGEVDLSSKDRDRLAPVVEETLGAEVVVVLTIAADAGAGTVGEVANGEVLAEAEA
uniref:Uncharacterized protein n=1 Tax=Anopheles atroparvus TaxID=41427 RepID=A0A182IYK2_ANOAO